MVAVLGISASSQAELLATIDRLGTKLLTLQAGESFFGDDSTLPRTARARIASLDGVTQAASVYAVPGATVRRNSLVDPATRAASACRQPTAICRVRSARSSPPAIS
jgi:putative ABC transport system permease protein